MQVCRFPVGGAHGVGFSGHRGPLFPDDTPIVGQLSAEDGSDWTTEATSEFGAIFLQRDDGVVFVITKIDATGRFEAKI